MGQEILHEFSPIKSRIKNDPNDWSKEHENPQYNLDLLLSVITVGVKTMDVFA
jgi:predicted helicase